MFGNPVGNRPMVLGHHRFEWLYVTGFVEPLTGATVWNISNNISKPLFERVLADFAKSVGAGKDKRIRVATRQCRLAWTRKSGYSRWNTSCLSTTLQSQNCNRPSICGLVDEPLVNGFFETLDHLDKAVAYRLRRSHQAARNDPSQHDVSLVAAPTRRDVINRIRYQIVPDRAPLPIRNPGNYDTPSTRNQHKTALT